MQIGFIGLGKMGSRMVEKLLASGHEVVAWNRSEAPVEELQLKIQNAKSKITDQNFKVAKSIESLVKILTPPRVIWLMLTAGEPTESVLGEVVKYAEPQDIVIDGGNAFYKDTQRRSETLSINQLRFLGIGVSGGVHALTTGYPLMVGGDISAYQHITPILDSLALPRGGHVYFGEGGAGHFVKMVHNGIEYGQMQAIAEGFGVLDSAPYEFDLREVAKLWQKSSLVSGFLLDRARDALTKDPELASIDGVIGSGSEAEWTVQQGKIEDVPVENIEQSLDFRKRSQTEKEISDSFAARMVAAIRHEFGGHDVKKK